MLTKLEVRTSLGDLLVLQLDDISTGLLVQEIEGLGPVKATLVSSSFATLDGELYQSSRRETRNIVVTLGFQPDYTNSSVRDLRKRLYSFFMPKTEVELRFYDSDGLVVNIMGRVESFGAPLFTKEPVVNLSLMCFDPDFIDQVPVTINGTTVADTGTVTSPTPVTYEGTVETGLVFTLNVDRPITEFTFYCKSPDDTLQRIDFEASLLADDVVTISTVSGNKFVTLNRGGTVSSLLYAISPQSNWIEFRPGVSQIRVYVVGTGIPYTIAYSPRYGGL